MIEIKILGNRVSVVKKANPHFMKSEDCEIAYFSCHDSEYAKATAQEVLEMLAALNEECNITEG